MANDPTHVVLEVIRRRDTRVRYPCAFCGSSRGQYRIRRINSFLCSACVVENQPQQPRGKRHVAS